MDHISDASKTSSPNTTLSAFSLMLSKTFIVFTEAYDHRLALMSRCSSMTGWWHCPFSIQWTVRFLRTPLDLICVGLFLRSLPCPTDWCVLPPRPPRMAYRSFTVSLEVGECQSSNFLLQYFVSSLGLLTSPTKFRISFADVNKITCWNFDWQYIESIHQVGKNSHLNNIIFPPKNIEYPFICSLISFLRVL